MKKTSLIIMLLLGMVFLFAGCRANAPEKKEELLSQKVNSVKVTYEQKNYKTTWSLKTDNIKKWEDWAKSLSFEPKTFEKGQSPIDEKEGESYTFDINNGEETFSYMDPDNVYILKNKKWYLVKNPSDPPVMEKKEKNKYVIMADSGEISSSAKNYSFKMKLLEGWKCESFLDDSHKDSVVKYYGFRIYPEDVKEGYINIFYPRRLILLVADNVGKYTDESEITLAGETAVVKKYQPFYPYWNEIHFKEKKKEVTIENNMADQWLGSYSEEVLEMLDTIEFEEKGKKFNLK